MYYGVRLNPSQGTASQNRVTVITRVGKRVLSPIPSQALSYHSEGFNWGYSGSGPAQLALAILLDASLDEEFALSHYTDFLEEHVSRWEDDWGITSSEMCRVLLELQL